MKVIRIVFGQVIEADSPEELERKVEELKAKYLVNSPQNPFHTPSTSRPSPITTVEAKTTNRRPDTEDETLTLDEPAETILPEDLGLVGEPDVEDEIVDFSTSSEEERGPAEEAAEEVPTEEAEDEEVIEVPENLEELSREELVEIAKALGLDYKVNTKTLIKRIREAIAEEEE